MPKRAVVVGSDVRAVQARLTNGPRRTVALLSESVTSIIEQGHAPKAIERVLHVGDLVPDGRAEAAVGLLVDGRTSIVTIGEQLSQKHGPEAKALAPRLYAAFEKIGLFKEPEFLQERERKEGRVTWKSSFPERYRAYH